MAYSEEDAIQAAYMDWIRGFLNDPLWVWHTANQRSTSPAHGKKLKRMGVRAGVPDVFHAAGVPPYLGLFIEFKTGKGVVSPAQKKVMQEIRKQGYDVLVCRGVEEAKQAFLNYWNRKHESNSTIRISVS